MNASIKKNIADLCSVSRVILGQKWKEVVRRAYSLSFYMRRAASSGRAIVTRACILRINKKNIGIFIANRNYNIKPNLHIFTLDNISQLYNLNCISLLLLLRCSAGLWLDTKLSVHCHGEEWPSYEYSIRNKLIYILIV